MINIGGNLIMIDRIKNIRFGFREDYDPDKRIVKQEMMNILFQLLI